ncbi:MAG: glycosyltransferase family 39 protein [Anaerolineae bacterium]|nr:glycosyltransferase family 39 protein [Anaerolineae bacterium]
MRVSHYVLRLLSSIDFGVVIAALLTLFIIQNLLQPGLPVTADLPIHLYRTLEYQQAWAPGVIVPRWAPNLAFGYGYPLFVFTPPLPHLLALAFHLAGLTLETALKVLIILTILLYAIGMYLLARQVLDSIAAGLVAAVVYAFAPFALREALLYGGNVPQFLAIGLFPWTLWAMTRVASTYSWRWTILAAVFYAGVMLSHLFQALVFTPVVGLYGVILFPILKAQAPRSGRAGTQPILSTLLPRSLTPLLPLLAIPLGLLLSAFFWLPAFNERVLTRAQADIYLEKSPFYIRYPSWTELVAWIYPLDARAANPYVPLTLGVVSLILAGLGLMVGVWLMYSHSRFGRKSPLHRPHGEGSCLILPPVERVRGGLPDHISPVYSIFFFALVAATAIFLTLPVSRAVWEIVAILQVAEFPWRLLGLANLGLAFLAGAALLSLPPKIRWPLAILCLVGQLVAVAPLLYPVIPFARYGQPTLADQIDYERRSQSVGTTTVSEYLPQTVRQSPTTSPLVRAFLAGENPERLDRDSLPHGATATLLKQNAVSHIYRLNTPTNFTLHFFQFDYPGWRAWLDDRPVEIRPEVDTGLMLIDIPAGRYTLAVHFGETPGRVAAMLLTGVTILGLVLGSIFVKRRVVGNQEGEGRISLAPSPRHFSISNMLILLGCGLIVVTALWLKPRLRPVFTVQSPPDRVLPAQHQADIHFSNGIRLAGYDLDKTVVLPGGRLQVVLYWETDTAPIKTNLQPFVHLDRLNDLTTIADATNYTPGDVTTESVLPTFHWDTARYVRDEHDLLVPPDTPPLAYAVRVGWIDPDDQNRLLPLAGGSGDTAQLTLINVSPLSWRQERWTRQLDIPFRQGDDAIRLTGFELEGQTPARLDFTLAWRSHWRPQNDYTVFAQLLDVNHNLVVGFDRPPLEGAYPTSTWLPEQIIIDPRHIPLTDVPPGTYRLIVGLYHPVSKARLTTDEGADFVELTTVTVEH